jgi:hypothetical protein
MRRRLLAALLCAAPLAALAPAGAAGAAGAPYIPSVTHPPARPDARPMRDDLIMGKPGQASVARAIAGASATTYYAQDGQAVSVELSPGYAPRATPEAVQAYVNLIGSRAHGPELKRLTMVIATLSEVQNRYCSPRALACYVPKYQVMIVPGEQTPSDEVPVEYVLTHEYGHHIAANRSNDPWPAIAWGPKAWASPSASTSRATRARTTCAIRGRTGPRRTPSFTTAGSSAGGSIRASPPTIPRSRRSSATSPSLRATGRCGAPGG